MFKKIKKRHKNLSTETVKKAVGIIKNHLFFNQMNKIKHYLIIFKKHLHPENHKIFFRKANCFL
ncbi:hypothetical protein A8139_14640 [Marinomonas primoryensis]|uniref:Uncharacterized protein n=1 Tax=Marinomonas primoryensis TaxID=178399 RepID=A0A2Z4PUD5_9GAMM|nr:hypothetical protein A8139_14640 [Marinomonas primoryensis]